MNMQKAKESKYYVPMNKVISAIVLPNPTGAVSIVSNIVVFACLWETGRNRWVEKIP